jgi:hypothetical protein
MLHHDKALAHNVVLVEAISGAKLIPLLEHSPSLAPEMFPNVTEKNSFMYSCQRNLLWRGHHQLIALSWVWTYLQSHSWNLPAIPYTLSGWFLFNNIQTNHSSLITTTQSQIKKSQWHDMFTAILEITWTLIQEQKSYTHHK